MEIEISLRDVDSRCPYCHDGFVGEEEAVDCGVCQAKSHTLCVEELRACGACGAAGAGGTIKVVIPKWIQPPYPVREYCGRKHVKARRQGGVRRSGLCVGCQEEWLRACGDADFREDLVERRGRTATPLFRRIGSRWNDEQQTTRSHRQMAQSLLSWGAICSLVFAARTGDPCCFLAGGVALLVLLVGAVASKRRED